MADAQNPFPEHIAIIMDGNGRWAKQKKLPTSIGHSEGSKAVKRTIKACDKLGVKYLSLYSFSTENWNRPEQEVSFLMNLFIKVLKKETPEMHKKNIRVKVLGNVAELPKPLQKVAQESESLTKDNTGLQVNIMMNYGARYELVQACQRITEKVAKGQISEIDEDAIEEHLYTTGIPSPEILIRTGGDYRISNFLLWQCAYSELFFIDNLWPEFGLEPLEAIISDYINRERRFGGR